MNDDEDKGHENEMAFPSNGKKNKYKYCELTRSPGTQTVPKPSRC